MTWPTEMTEREREAAEERAAIIAEGCKVTQDEAEARVIELWLRAKQRRLARSNAT